MALNNLFLTIKRIFGKSRCQSFSLSSMFFSSCKSHSDVAIHGRSDTDENGTFFHDFAFLFYFLLLLVLCASGGELQFIKTYTIAINILPCIGTCEEEFIGSDSDDGTVFLSQAVVVGMLFSV